MAQARHRSVSCLVLIKLRRVYSRSKKTVKSEFYHFSGYASGFHPSRFPLACERAPPLALPVGVRVVSTPRAPRRGARRAPGPPATDVFTRSTHVVMPI